MRCFPSVLVLALLAGGAAAQTTLVFPPLFKNHAGNAYHGYIFNPSGPKAYQQARFMEVNDLNFSKTTTIKSMAFRWYAGLNFYYHQSFQADLELTLSTARTTGSTISSTFATNAGKDATVVIARKKVHFPPKLTYGTFPNPFRYKLFFDTGKTFTLPARKSLCWEIKVYANDLYLKKSYFIYLDWALLSSSACSYMDYGKGSDAGNPLYRYKGIIKYNDFNPSLGHRIFGSCYWGPAFGKAFAVIGLDKAPGGGLPIGPLAKLYIHPARILTVAGPYDLNYFGGISVPPSKPFLTIPNLPAYQGAKIYGQFIALDSGFKNIYGTNGRVIQLPLWSSTAGKTLGMGYVYMNGPWAFLSSSGRRGVNTGVIVQFTL